MRIPHTNILSIVMASSQILLATCLGAMPAHAQVTNGLPTELGIARSVSIFSVLLAKCTATIDVHQGLHYQESFTTIGEKVWGKSHFDSVLAPEKRRRLVEANATGPAWCSYQQAYLEKEGVSDLFLTNGAAPDPSLSGEALARITASAFASWDAEQTASGETGTIPAIGECYKDLGNHPTQADAARCIAMDHLGYTLASYTSQYMHVSLNNYFQAGEYQVRVYEVLSKTTPPENRRAFLNAIIKSTDADFQHWYDTHVH